MDKLKKFNNYKERQLRKATTARQKRTINSKKFFNDWKRKEKISQIKRTRNRIDKAVSKFDVDFYTKDKLAKFFKGKGLRFKSGRNRANKIVKEINKGTFNIDKYLKRDKEYQQNIKELNGKNLSIYEKTQILHRDIHYFENRELIIEYHNTPYGKKFKQLGNELNKKWEIHQNNEIDKLIKKYGKN